MRNHLCVIFLINMSCNEHKKINDFIIHQIFLQGLNEEINYASHTSARIEHLLKARPGLIIPKSKLFPYK